MTKKPSQIVVVAIIVVLGFIIAGPLYIIEEGQQAVIVRMGEIVRVVQDAGLYAKIPFIDNVVRYPKRILIWDGEESSVPTLEKQLIWVDVTARWRISDPQKFYVAVSDIGTALNRLGMVINAEVRNVTAENYFRESVRSTNLIMDREITAEDFGVTADIDLSILEASITPDTDHGPIEKGRRQLAEEILERSRLLAPEFGIELIDVVTRQIRYSDDLTQSVYERMIKERNQIAQAIRSEGEGRRAAIIGRMENDKLTILSEANARSQAIRGEADATAARTYADAYNQNRAFFDFWRAIESYRQTLPDIDKTLTTDMEYFRYLHNPR